MIFKKNLKNIVRKIQILGFFIVSASFVFAQGLQYEMTSYTANNNDATTPIFNINFLNQQFYTVNYQSFSGGVRAIFDLAIGLSIATAVIVFTLGAFQGIVNQGSTKDKIRGKELMTNSMIGLMIVLSTWLIINTINPDLLRLPILQGLENVNVNTGAGSGTGQPTSIIVNSFE